MANLNNWPFHLPQIFCSFIPVLTMQHLIELNKLFPFKILLKLLLITALSIQLIIISYNHISGYYFIVDFTDFLLRLTYGTFFSMIAGLLLAYPDLLVIYWANKKAPWSQKPVKRIIFELFAIIFLGLVVALFITILAHLIDRYEEPLIEVIVNNVLIIIVINLLLLITLEAWLFFNENITARKKAEKMEQEITNLRFEMLKSQINPHFMFNSLNVLSGLVTNNPRQAQEFIDEFALVYRYVLETIEKKLVSIDDELDFIQSYMFLQKMRYGSHLHLQITLESKYLSYLVPPLSLQVVIENAIKHNNVSDTSSFSIFINAEDNWLTIKNKLKTKISRGYSSKMGQNNLIKRYALVCNAIPRFNIEDDKYIVKLPLLKPKKNESNNY